MAITIDPLGWADASLKARMQTDPVAVLKERGINLPDGLPLPVVHDVLRIVCAVWVDGQTISYNQFHIDPSDEGLLFGRGVWESTRTLDGMPWLWNLHLDRLKKTAEQIGINLAADRLPDANRVRNFVRSLTVQEVIVRLNVSAGRPGMPGKVWMTLSLRPSPNQQVRLRTQKSQVHFTQPILCGKTFHYAYRLETSKEAFQAGYDTGLMIDDRDNILEASHANIFLKFADGWVTPANDRGLFLPGTVRAHLLREAPLKVREEVIPKTRLSEVKEAFVTNSNVGIVPVVKIDSYDLAVGVDTQNLARWLSSETVQKNPVSFS